jgi:Flp pilus assembly pilin Flp
VIDRFAFISFLFMPQEAHTMDRIKSLVARGQEEDGASLAEYAMLLALIAVVVAAAVAALQGGIINAFNAATAAL